MGRPGSDNSEGLGTVRAPQVLWGELSSHWLQAGVEEELRTEVRGPAFPSPSLLLQVAQGTAQMGKGSRARAPGFPVDSQHCSQSARGGRGEGWPQAQSG